MTTDVLVEGRHFRRDWSSATDVGHKAAAQSLADVAAMGARPTALLVGLAARPTCRSPGPSSWPTGLQQECAPLGVSVAGGDVVRGDCVVVSVTALGDLEGREPVTRSGAEVGDVVAVYGRLGWSAAGMAVLQRGFRSPRVLADAHRRPEPPYAQGVKAAVAGAHAMTDVSDGLLADLGHVARASGVRIEVNASSFDAGRTAGRRRRGARRGPARLGADRRRGPRPRRDLPSRSSTPQGLVDDRGGRRGRGRGR